MGILIPVLQPLCWPVAAKLLDTRPPGGGVEPAGPPDVVFGGNFVVYLGINVVSGKGASHGHSRA